MREDMDLSARQQQDMQRQKTRAMLVNAGLAVLLLAAFVVALGLGKYSVSPIESIRILFGARDGADLMAVNVVLGLRLPRLLASVVCGAALALSGAVYQSVFQNPLVSPDFLGVSQGACVGAAAGILLGASSGLIQLLAFGGGLLAVALTLLIPFLMRSDSNVMLVLSGIIIGGVMSSVLGFLKYIADPETQLAAITYWQMGNFSYVKMDSLLVLLPLMVLPALLLFGMAWRIDIVSLGEDEARTLGANVGVIRLVTVLCATLLTASAVCISGTIGWVGLVIPHFARMMVGTGNRRLLPAACFVGGLFMLFVDTVTRLIGPAEMPISILTGIIGAPFYAWLLYKRRATIR